MRGEPAVGALLAQLDVALVFGEAFAAFVAPIAVGHFVAQHAAAADRRDAVFQARQGCRRSHWATHDDR